VDKKSVFWKLLARSPVAGGHSPISHQARQGALWGRRSRPGRRLGLCPMVIAAKRHAAAAAPLSTAPSTVPARFAAATAWPAWWRGACAGEEGRGAEVPAEGDARGGEEGIVLTQEPAAAAARRGAKRGEGPAPAVQVRAPAASAAARRPLPALGSGKGSSPAGGAAAAAAHPAAKKAARAAATRSQQVIFERKEERKDMRALWWRNILNKKTKQESRRLQRLSVAVPPARHAP
jgi:hypothetical protein